MSSLWGASTQLENQSGTLQRKRNSFVDKRLPDELAGIL